VTIEKILDRLDNVKPSGKGFMAKCPSHVDKSPSLSLMELPDGRILMKCFAGCETNEVLTSIGLSMGDLFPNGGLGHFKGFQQIEEKFQEKKRSKNSKDEIILEIAKSDRARGKRLSQVDLEIEKQAFMRIRHANT